MRVLVTWGLKRGGTEGIGKTLGEARKERDDNVGVAAAKHATDVDRCIAALIGGALYANR